MKYLKFMPFNTVSNASRNRRELAAAAEYGFEAYCYSSDRVPPENVKGDPFSLICDDTPIPILDPSVPHMVRILRVFRNMLQHARKLRALRMDVISCHNIKSLATAYLAYWYYPPKKRPALIYDSHELELARKPRSPLRKRLLKFAEGFLLRRCAFTIVVNDGIGEELRRIHKLKDEPIVVVRSTPEYWNIDASVSKEIHKEYCEKLGIPEGSFITCYTGGLQEYRGLEQIIEALVIDPGSYSVWVGDPQKEQYEAGLLKLIQAGNVSARLLRYPAQPHKELWKYVSAAAVAIVMNDSTNENYKYALPNKFFEAIQSLTPIICTDSVEMARIVRQYDIGLLVPSGDGKKLAEAIQHMREDKELYARFKQNLVRAKEELCWEKEKETLLRMYMNL